jgi:hypothetical protein
MICHILVMLLGGVSAPPLSNGDFERGLEGWGAQNGWYELPKGAGLSKVVVAEGEGRNGSKSLKIVGEGNRNLALQGQPAWPGRYRVTGWIKCEKVEAGQAGVLLEWMGRESKWLRGDWAVHVTGTADWQSFDATLEAPSGTRSVHFDLITDQPNHGTVWFDDVRWERLESSFPDPQPPTISATAPAGRDGCVEVTWDPQLHTPGTCRLLIYCDSGASAGGVAIPRATPDSDEGRVLLDSLEAGREYRIAAAAVNLNGKRSAIGPEVRVALANRQAPRPGWISAQAIADGRVRVSWSPHVLDPDIATVHVGVAGRSEGELRELDTIDAQKLYAAPRPFYCTTPWAAVDLKLPDGSAKVGVWCEDATGNRGPIGWTEVKSAYPAESTQAPCALWTAPPTEQLPRNANAPESPATSFELTLMRGQAKGFQAMVRPDSPLQRVQVKFSPLVHEDGSSHIDAQWLAYHFVDYVLIEKNSRETPKDELLWPGPAEYPEPLSDDSIRDLPAGQVQPIFVRVAAPRDAKPGLYRGQGMLESEQGAKSFEIAVRVAPVVLPEQTRLKFVYWFSWDAPCKELGVEMRSADGWRALSRLGELMREHHQNSVVVSTDLVATWRTADGTLVHDFRDFDRFVETFRAAGVDRLFCLSHVGSRSTGEWDCPTMQSHGHNVRRLDTGEPEQIDVIEMLPAFQQHLEAKGWLERFVIHVADEPIGVNVESYRQLSARVHKAAPKLRRIDAIHVPDLQGSLEIFVPQINYFEQWLDQYRKVQLAGNELWFYIAWVPQGHFPNRMIDSHAIKSRVLHWLNATYDTTGYLHWALNHWSIPLTSLGSPGDQYIAWPSHRYIANSSLRYEAEREGLEDCELMFMLRDALQKSGMNREQAQAQVEAIARKAVRSVQDYTRSWREMEDVRRELLERLAATLAESAQR